MDVNSIKLIYFSPTGTTKTIAEAIAEGMDRKFEDHYNLTTIESNQINFKEFNDEVAIIGAPVYAGRVQEDAKKRILKIKGNNCPAIIVVLYGNREYEDALLELRDISIEAGFKPVACAAFIGEHSFSTEKYPVAKERPDSEDIRKAREFGKDARDKINGLESIESLPKIDLPGNFPYKDHFPKLNNSPEITGDCTLCETCVSSCPVGAISLEEEIITDKTLCIYCCACLRACPEDVRSFDIELINSKREMLSKKCSMRKEAEFFL